MRASPDPAAPGGEDEKPSSEESRETGRTIPSPSRGRASQMLRDVVSVGFVLKALCVNPHVRESGIRSEGLQEISISDARGKSCRISDVRTLMFLLFQYPFGQRGILTFSGTQMLIFFWINK